MDHNTRQEHKGGPPSVVGRKSGPPAETTQDRTQSKNTRPDPGQRLKTLNPPGIEPGPSSWKAGILLL